MKITRSRTAYGDEIDVKRFYIPGTKLTGECPKCGAKVAIDFGNEYLSYPSANEDFVYTTYCHKCEHEWPLTLRLDVKLSMVSE